MGKLSDKLIRYFDGDEMASNVWLQKYAMVDEDGIRIEETPDDMHRRMAKYFSEIEEKYEFQDKGNLKLKLSEYGYNRDELTEDKIYSLLKDFKYIVPGGSVMYGLGSKLPVSLSNCFVAGTKVLTTKGLVNIEEVNEGDFVLSDDGEYHKVVATMERDYSGDLYKFDSIEIYEPIICTPNHKFLTNNGWKRADRILAPHSKQIHSCDKLKIARDKNKVFSHNGEGENNKLVPIEDYANIKSIEILENQNVKVYNLSVEDTHTYNVNGVICHNCWVIKGPEDSIDDIFRVCNEQSQLFKRRGGNGFDISKLRPKGAKVNNSAKYSTGAVSFMELFSNVTNTIAQSGRRGALMISMHIDHPDVEEFIEKKQDLTKVTGANVSVQIGDDFMKAVEADSDYIQRWPIDSRFDYDANCEYDNLYETKDANGKTCYYKKIKAKKLWNKLIHCAWNTAEPGIIFKTNHYEYSPDGVYDEFRGTSTNPCGEIFMNEDSCRLIHVNLSSFVENEFTDKAKVEHEKLYEVFYEAVRLGDDLVDLEKDAIERILAKIESDGDKNGNEYKLYRRLLDNSLRGRRCGVGFFGLSDMIAKLGFKFDSDESLKVIDEVMRTMFIAEIDSEVDMAITRGTFPGYNSDKEKLGNRWYDTLKTNFSHSYEKMMKFGRRNVSFGTAAPTGSVAMLAHCSSGIEPIFMPFYTRRVKCASPNDRVDFIDKDGEKFTEYITVHYPLKYWAQNILQVDVDGLNTKDWQDIYEKSPWYKSTANDIDWVKRVTIQSICQKYITHSISSTVNLPNNVKESEVGEIYLEAWRQGLKGITVYRDGCRSGVIVSTEKKETQKKDVNQPPIENGTARRRPKTLDAKIIRFSNKGDKWVGIIGMLDGKPYELFTGMLDKLNIPNWVDNGYIIKNYDEVEVDGETKKKSRYDLCYEDKDGYRVCIEGISRIFNPEFWNYGKLISGLLRHHMPIPYIVKVISSLKLDDSTINTWKNGVVRVLRKFEDSTEIEGEKCPECGGRLVREGGCIHCVDCGYSKCS